MREGTYAAKIKNYGVSKPFGNAKRPSIFIQFELDAGGKTESIYWWGSMEDRKPNSTATKQPYEITIQTLIKMGLKGTDPYAVADNAPGVLSVFQEYELVIEPNTHNGKTNMRVKYINLPGEGGVRAKLSASEAKMMAGFDFGASVLAARKEALPSDAKARTASEVSANNDETNTDDIPF